MSHELGGIDSTAPPSTLHNPSAAWDKDSRLSEALDDCRLPLAAFRIYMHLLRRGWKTHTAWPSVRTMSEYLGISKDGVCSAISQLADHGFISVTRTIAGSTYEILPMENWKPFTKKKALGGCVLNHGTRRPESRNKPGDSAKQDTKPSVLNHGTACPDPRNNGVLFHGTESIKEEDVKRRRKEKGAKESPRLTLDSLVEDLAPLYPWINPEVEKSKIRGWMIAHPGKRQLTRRFVVNWFNRIDPPVNDAGGNVQKFCKDGKTPVADLINKLSPEVQKTLQDDGQLKF